MTKSSKILLRSAAKSSPKNPLKRANASELTKQRLCECATQLFATRGFEGTSMADIASSAGLSKANVLYHFASKDALWQSAVDQLWANVDSFMQSCGVGRGELPVTREGFAQLVRTYIETCVRFPAYVSIPNLEGHDDTWRSRWLAEKHLGRHLSATRQYLDRLQKTGILRTRNSFIVQAFVGGGAQLLLGQFALWRAANPDIPDTGALVDQYIEEVLQLMLNV